VDNLSKVIPDRALWPATFAERLEFCRRSKRWTQEEVSHYVGCSRVYWSLMEGGKRRPGPDILARMCLVFGCSADWLLLGRERPIPKVLSEQEGISRGYKDLG